MSKSIERTMLKIVDLLVRKDYVGLAQMTQGVRLAAAEIEASVADYGRTLVMPPPAAFARVDAIAIRGSSPAAYSIRFALYTAEEGRSDLELQATFVEDPGATTMRVQLDNILVA